MLVARAGLEVLDGSVLTHRVRHGLAGRDDLWVNLGLQPPISILLVEPVPLATGGDLRLSRYGHDAVIGPAGWLPALETGDVLGVRSDGSAVRLEEVDGTTACLARRRIRQHARRSCDTIDARGGGAVRRTSRRGPRS